MRLVGIVPPSISRVELAGALAPIALSSSCAAIAGARGRRDFFASAPMGAGMPRAPRKMMRRSVLCLLLAAVASGCSSDPDEANGGSGPRPIPDPIPPHELAGSCGLEQPAFCEDFAAVHPGG